MTIRLCTTTGKQRFWSQQSAENALKDRTRSRRWHKRVRSGWFEVRAYECPHCGGWHLTSQDRDAVR